MVEKFKQEDIDYWSTISKTHPGSYGRKYVVLDYNKTNIEIPVGAVNSLICGRFSNPPAGLLTTPMKLRINFFEEQHYSDYWVGDSNYLGVIYEDNGGVCEIFLREGVEHSTLSLLWLILHEYRHFMQYYMPCLESNVMKNQNFYEFADFFISQGVSQNTFEHVFHEIMPYEIDANVFACEILGIDYPGSKFEITPERIQLLKSEIKQNEKTD